ncbi:peptidase C69 [Rhodoferax koreense]|uniref:Peptidase C69 n=1 Tax=Rhodoferax koreensis TaxID=1842727 RepID=A0A1P8JUI0_9BURK|nr:TldD/PmbA family protein [Rhodoferax koreense]APW37385.1 peptidase C69 [Rhodoferax koreense]
MDKLEIWAQEAARLAAPEADFWSVRHVVESAEQLNVRQNLAESPVRTHDEGVMVCVVSGGAMGYGATGDVSGPGIRQAFSQAMMMAQAAAGHSVFDYRKALAEDVAPAAAHYRSPNRRPVGQSSLKERFDLLMGVSHSLKLGSEIVDWSASLWTTHTEQRLVTSRGDHVAQAWDFVVPNILAVASVGGETQTRSAAGQYNGFCQQGSLEVLDRAGFANDGPRVAREAIELARAPNCPTGEMDLVLMPDQMMLQIHESIGHPLELDRILGDERNFAGTSFVTLDMFGSYAYGSDLLNVTFDPTRGEQFASFGFDDEGTPARREFIIEKGLLQRPLGGSLSQQRAHALGVDFEAVATTRACSWNRAPIDRMSNLNIEPGTSSLADMIASVEDGILMKTNASWSIDDSRNKFQFGCEYGQRIREGQLAEVVKKPSYRGISSTFWRSLAMVGDASTFEVMGTPFCGKGEPNQVVRVGHAAPACKFSRVSVFGGAN